jgi:transcriptional regulator with XRE-family HTH domain
VNFTSRGVGLNGGDARHSLAARLRDLREQHWPELRITQPQLARALGGLSVPLISSWESTANPRIPPVHRLEAYARLFATPRSFDGGAPRLIDRASLTDAERRTLNELTSELMRLRGRAMEAAQAEPGGGRSLSESIGSSPWRFDDGGTVTAVCAKLPQHMLDKIPYTDVNEPDFIELLTYSELDSLFELYGHLRAANPGSHVYRRIANELKHDDIQTHLAVLGGVDWNSLTKTIMERLQLPVHQVADWDTDGGQYFEVETNGATEQYQPVLRTAGGQTVLEEDVALFVRAANPFNRLRTVTICNGMYGRGTYGAVRALTDVEFRDRNGDYLSSRFAGCDSYCVLTRVQIVNGATLTPDWSSGEHTLFEWPPAA